MSIPSPFIALIKNLILTRIFPGETAKPVDYLLPNQSDNALGGDFIRVSSVLTSETKTVILLETSNPVPEIVTAVLAEIPPYPEFPNIPKPFPTYEPDTLIVSPRDIASRLETVSILTGTIRKYTDFLFQIFANDRFHEWTPHELNKPYSSLLSQGTISTPEVMTIPFDCHSILLNNLYFIINIAGNNNPTNYWRIELQVNQINSTIPGTIATVTTSQSPTNTTFRLTLNNSFGDGYIYTQVVSHLSLKVSAVGNPGKIRYAYTGKYYKAKAPLT